MVKYASRCLASRAIIIIKPRELEQIKININKFITFVGNIMSRGSSLSSSTNQANPSASQLQPSQSNQAISTPTTNSNPFDPTSFTPPVRLRAEDLRAPPPKRQRNGSTGPGASSPASTPIDAKTPNTPANQASPQLGKSPNLDAKDGKAKKRKSSSAANSTLVNQVKPLEGGDPASILGLQMGASAELKRRKQEDLDSAKDPLAFFQNQFSNLQSVSQAHMAPDAVPVYLSQAMRGLRSPEFTSPSMVLSSIEAQQAAQQAAHNQQYASAVDPSPAFMPFPNLLRPKSPSAAPTPPPDDFDISFFIRDDDSQFADEDTTLADDPSAAPPDGSSPSTKAPQPRPPESAATPDLVQPTEGIEESPVSVKEAISPSKTSPVPSSVESGLSVPLHPSDPSADGPASGLKASVSPLLDTPSGGIFLMGEDAYFGGGLEGFEWDGPMAGADGGSTPASWLIS